MARFNIIDAKTGSVKYSGAPRYNGTYCKVSYLEFSEICSDSLISWNIGDYIVYPRTGLTYRLFDIPQPKKRSYRSEYGGAYVYSNVQFFADTKWLEIEPFRDIVPVDNKIHFTTQSSWSVWTNVEGLIARLNAVMQAAHPDEWEFRLVNASEDSELYKLLHDEYLDFTVSGESVLDGLGKIYDSFGNIGWIHSVEDGKNIITVGIPPIYQDIGDFTEVYRYGAGRGLTEIRKSVTNKNELKTRLYAYGSTRNMIPRYYNELTPAIKDADSVNIPNLMLPLNKWGMTNGKRDASKAFVERNVSKYGLRPDTVYFDGSNGNKEIYPSIEGTTIGDLYDAMAEGEAYRPDLAKHNRSIRLDAVESVRGIVDDGIESDSGAKYVDTIIIPVTANSGDYKENFDISLFSGVQAPMSGKVTIPLSGITIIGTSESTPYYLSYRATITVAGRNYVTDIYNPELSASIKFSLEDVEVECSEGDEISATLSCVRDNSAPATHIEINQVTLAAGIASKKDNSIVITIPQIGFDISTRAALGSQGIATISMKDGMCGGRSFVVKSCAYFESTDSWELTLYRGRDESLGMLFPNTTYPISAGDHFVLLDIAMPDTYIGMAEQRLLTAANELLDSVSEQKPFYELSVDAKYMIENNLTLLEGRYMRLSDTDMISDVEYVLIDTVVINESESSIPTYRVTLREQKRVSYSNSQSSGDSLTSLASGGGLIESGLTPKQKKILSCFDIDDEGDIYTKSDENGRARGLYSYSFVSSAGKSDTPGTGGGTVVGATVGGVDVELIDGVLKFDAYPTAASLGLGNIAFKDSLTIADVANLQSDLDEIRTLAEEGHTANESLTIVSVTLQSLQAQIDSLTNKNHFDELIASVLSADIVTAQRAYIGTIYGSLDGNAATATKLSDNTAFTAWGQTFFENGKPKNVSGALTGATTIEASTSIKIGNATISWDSKYGCLKVDKGLYSTDFLSSGGKSDTEGAGSGTVIGATVGGVEVKLIDGVLKFDAYPTAASLGLKDLAFKDFLSVNDIPTLNISKISGLQSALDGKQAVISDLDTIRANASNGNTAYNDLSTVSTVLQSLQAQIDSLAGAKGDEVIATVVSTDIVTAQNAYIAVMHGSLDGNAATATKLSDNTTFTAWGQTFFENGKPKNVSGALTGATTIEASTSIKIGNATISWDSKYGCLKVDKGLYSTSFLSSAGFSDTQGTGGGTVVGATVGGVEVKLIDGILEFDAYPTTTSLGLKNLAFQDSLAVAEVVGLQSELDGKQNVISNLATIMVHADEGHTAYGYFSNGKLPYSSVSGIPTKLSQFTNDSGYITSSGSCAYATSAGNADTLDGYHATSGANTPWGTIPVITTDGWMDVGKQFEFHYNNTTGSDFSTVLRCTGNYANLVNLPSASGTLALLTDNVASATKLQTARTIWGHSFDGTTNISGDIIGAAGGVNIEYDNEINCYNGALYLNNRGSIDGYNGGHTSNILALCYGGNFGIGTASPAAKLHVEGNILATGAVTAGQASDARLKSNIVTVMNACGILRSLRGVEFDWNSVATENCKDLTGHDVGLIAQEVESLIPSAIGTIWGEYKRLDYTKITPYLVEGWKAHDDKINKLEERISALER